MVREAIGSALPTPRKKTNRPKWKLKVAVEFIDAILEGDRKARASSAIPHIASGRGCSMS